jgi:hypothetical protein
VVGVITMGIYYSAPHIAKAGKLQNKIRIMFETKAQVLESSGK